jgi:hypothetical protein
MLLMGRPHPYGCWSCNTLSLGLTGARVSNMNGYAQMERYSRFMGFSFWAGVPYIDVHRIALLVYRRALWGIRWGSFSERLAFLI